MDRNYPPGPPLFLYGASLSARRAWIEIPVLSPPFGAVWVALRKESVDRNIVEIHPDGRLIWSLSARRAWIENHDDYLKLAKFEGSLSARRAWIEMIGKQKSVDEDYWSLSTRRAWIEISCSRCSDGPAWSLSARRAWIEITNRREFRKWGAVALRKESVDRNNFGRLHLQRMFRRSPQGERG